MARSVASIHDGPDPGVVLRNPCRVHMIGIGGAGMEPLACLLSRAGHRVTGSDLVDGDVVDSLRRGGIHVATGAHDAAQVDGADLVVSSAAVASDNPELVAARAAGTIICSRADLLGWYSRQRPMIAVAGTHGKTTTASMIAAVARAAGEAPGVVIGGWQDGASQADTGGADLLIAEADEFNRSFLSLYPVGAVVTNIEADHHDTYQNDADIDAAFATFLQQTQEWIVTHDEPRCRQATKMASAAVSWCGPRPSDSQPTTGIQLEKVDVGPDRSRMHVCVEGVAQPPVDVMARGRHNVDNALTVIGVAARMNWEWGAVQEGLGQFRGVDRRLQNRGELDGTQIIDDYAHHPTEVAAALNWARSTGRRIVAVFQPHLFSRTAHLATEFAQALQLADDVWISDIYAAREEPIPGVTSGLLIDRLQRMGRSAHHVNDAAEAIVAALESCRHGDMLLVMGAGDIGGQLDYVLSQSEPELA